MGNPNSIYCRWRRWDTGHMCRAYHPSACDRVSAVSAGVQFSGVDGQSPSRDSPLASTALVPNQNIPDPLYITIETQCIHAQ